MSDDDRCKIDVDALYWSYDKEMTFNQFIKHLNKVVPQEYRKTATVKFERGSYDSGDAFKVTYTRLETDKEYKQRKKRHAMYEAQQKENERQELRRLKRKFGEA